MSSQPGVLVRTFLADHQLSASLFAELYDQGEEYCFVGSPLTTHRPIAKKKLASTDVFSTNQMKYGMNALSLDGDEDAPELDAIALDLTSLLKVQERSTAPLIKFARNSTIELVPVKAVLAGGDSPVPGRYDVMQPQWIMATLS